MTRRTIGLLFIALMLLLVRDAKAICVAPLGAQTSAPIPKTVGAVAEVIKGDYSTGKFIVRVNNVSQKEITAFTIFTDATYAERRRSHGELLVSRPLQPNTGVDVPLQTAPSPTRVDFTMAAVVYADNTADVQNQEAFGRIVNARKAIARTHRAALTILKKHLDDASDADPVASSLPELQQLVKLGRQKPEEYMGAEGIINELKESYRVAAALKTPHRDYLRKYAEEHEKTTVEAEGHTQIREVRQ